jgi:hypothetical protein
MLLKITRLGIGKDSYDVVAANFRQNQTVSASQVSFPYFFVCHLSPASYIQLHIVYWM